MGIIKAVTQAVGGAFEKDVTATGFEPNRLIRSQLLYWWSGLFV